MRMPRHRNNAWPSDHLGLITEFEVNHLFFLLLKIASDSSPIEGNAGAAEARAGPLQLCHRQFRFFPMLGELPNNGGRVQPDYRSCCTVVRRRGVPREADGVVQGQRVRLRKRSQGSSRQGIEPSLIAASAATFIKQIKCRGAKRSRVSHTV